MLRTSSISKQALHEHMLADDMRDDMHADSAKWRAALEAFTPMGYVAFYACKPLLHSGKQQKGEYLELDCAVSMHGEFRHDAVTSTKMCNR